MTMTQAEFQAIVQEGLPQTPAPAVERNPEWSHAPVRKDILTAKEKELALRNALRYFPAHQHAELAPEFAQELKDYGRIYMYRLRSCARHEGAPHRLVPRPSAARPPRSC